MTWRSLVFKLHKVIYGFKQTPCSWFHKLSATLSSFDFSAIRSDTSLFFKLYKLSKLSVSYICWRYNNCIHICSWYTISHLNASTVCFKKSRTLALLSWHWTFMDNWGKPPLISNQIKTSVIENKHNLFKTSTYTNDIIFSSHTRWKCYFTIFFNVSFNSWLATVHPTD